MLLLIFLESAKLIAIYALRKAFKSEEEVDAFKERVQISRLITFVNAISEIQFEDETAAKKLVKRD